MITPLTYWVSTHDYSPGCICLWRGTCALNRVFMYYIFEEEWNKMHNWTPPKDHYTVLNRNDKLHEKIIEDLKK